MHLTGPMRAAVHKAPGHERPLLACVSQLSAAVDVAGGPGAPSGAAAPAHLLRPLPYLLYLADGASEPGGYNVFHEKARLKPAQKVFKRFPMADCSPPASMIAELGLAAGHPVHLGTVRRAGHLSTLWFPCR